MTGGRSSTGDVVIKILDINDNIPTLENEMVRSNTTTGTSRKLFCLSPIFRPQFRLLNCFAFAVRMSCGGEHGQHGGDEGQSHRSGYDVFRQLAVSVQLRVRERSRLFQHHHRLQDQRGRDHDSEGTRLIHCMWELLCLL